MHTHWIGLDGSMDEWSVGCTSDPITSDGCHTNCWCLTHRFNERDEAARLLRHTGQEVVRELPAVTTRRTMDTNVRVSTTCLFLFSSGTAASPLIAQTASTTTHTAQHHHKRIIITIAIYAVESTHHTEYA